jgi:hypothetical protein
VQSGDTSVEGRIGSYCWLNTCADAPRIPPKGDLPMLVASAGPLEFSLSDSARFTRWTISYGEESDGTLEVLEQGGANVDPDVQPQPSAADFNAVEFGGPPAGDWTLHVFVQFPGGDLSYAWHVVVT